jgi:SAM-dependent methyltransferase
MVPSKLPVRFRPLVLMLLVGAVTSTALAQDRPAKLDVPYVPTPPAVVARMLEVANVRQNDFVIDLGSGDGRIAIAAAKDRGARALGVDIDPARIREANENAKNAGVADRVTFRQQNLFETPIGEATVLTMYLLEEVNRRLRPRILAELRPGTRVVSHAFDMGEWEADQHSTVNGRDVYFWVVPAKVEGRWEVNSGNRRFDIDLKQTFQKIQGSASINGRSAPLRNAQLRGDMIQFTVQVGEEGPLALRGRVVGDAIEGLAAQGGTSSGSQAAPSWRASRRS